MENKSFNESCYELLKKVPSGKITTYREIAHGLNCRAYRAVGNAMNKNPYDTADVPCHRVVNSDGRVGGFAWEPELKVSRLKAEGVETFENSKGILKIKNFKDKLYSFE
jgi:methylated-DNA-[protein]-cysteine S-methyltransferase